LPTTIQVGLARSICCAPKPSISVNAQGAQLVAHRRVDAGVAAGDAVAGFAGQRGQAAHEGAADTKDVDMHGRILRRAGTSLAAHEVAARLEMAAHPQRAWWWKKVWSYGPAKRRAVKQLGLPSATCAAGQLTEIEEAVREYIACSAPTPSRRELRALRELALVWMQRHAELSAASEQVRCGAAPHTRLV